MAARLTRAKKKIVLAGIPLGAPLAYELRSRLDEVCRTIYLAFTAGYTPAAGPDLVRADLAGDAVRLAAMLHELVPGAAQVQATLAILVLQHSRRDARERDGVLVTLAEQDRSVWHHDEIRNGLGLVAGLRPADGHAEGSGRRLRRGAPAPGPHRRRTREGIDAAGNGPGGDRLLLIAPAISTSPGPAIAPRSTGAPTTSNEHTWLPGSTRSIPPNGRRGTDSGSYGGSAADQEKASAAHSPDSVTVRISTPSSATATMGVEWRHRRPISPWPAARAGPSPRRPLGGRRSLGRRERRAHADSAAASRR